MTESTFEEWLHKNPQYREIVAAIREKHGGSLSAEVRDYLVDSSRRSTQQFLATKNWIQRTRGLCHRILADVAPDAEYVLFWIYLYGLVFELHGREDKRRDITMMIPWRRPYVEALDALHDCLTESERSFVRFMRHNHVHILIDYPWQRVRVKNGVIVDVIEANDPDAVRNAKCVLASYDDDQNAAAVDFVKKVVSAVDDVSDAFKEAAAI